MLANNITALVDALGFPAEGRTKQGDRLGLLNFVRGEKNAGSFWINVSGSQVGKWIDYVDRDSLRGDALALVYYTMTGQARPSSASQWRLACEWAERWLGIAGGQDAFKGVPSGELQAQQAVAASQRAKLEALEATKLNDERMRMHARWLKAETLHPQTRAWAYLQGRGIDLESFAARDDVPGAIRFEPEGVYAWDPDKKVAETWPAMICGLWRLQEGGKQAFAGVHITFLDRDSNGKAPVKTARKMRPRGINGAFIPISKGRDGLSTGDWIKQAPPRSKLIITEGVEDALTQAMMYPDVRVWAAGSVWNMGALTIPGHVADVVLVGDNDTGKDAKRAFRTACLKINTQLQDPERAAGAGRLTVRRAVGWKDFNDALQAKILRDGGAVGEPV
jgi:hypothetical protein